MALLTKMSQRYVSHGIDIMHILQAKINNNFCGVVTYRNAKMPKLFDELFTFKSFKYFRLNSKMYMQNVVVGVGCALLVYCAHPISCLAD